jgi:hypothetical protein
MVCNAYHIKNVPGGRLTGTTRSGFVKRLAQGLLKPSFVPDREQREFRDMTRFRKSQIEERSRNINRLQKFLEGGNIKLGSWLSDIKGKSAGQFLELVIGKPDFTLEDVKARMHGRMKSTPEKIFASLDGYLTDTQRVFFNHIIAIIRQQTEQIIAETGTDMSNFRNQHAFSNWTGAAPKNAGAAEPRLVTKSSSQR